MKIRMITLVAILAIALAGIFPSAALAGAYDTAFTTSITYQNVSNRASTSIQILFYASADAPTPTTITRPNLQPGAGTSVFIGGLGEINPGFRGSAIMQSDVQLVATLVQLPQGSTTVRNRPLSNGFSSGSSQMLIATVLKNQFDTNTVFSVQNVGNSATTVTIRFYNTQAQQVHNMSQAIQPGGAYYVDAGQVGQLGAQFNGSALIEGGGGQIIASAMELAIQGVSASAFEGVGQGSTTFYMPSALCEAFGGTNTAYAIQNTSLTETANVSVTYYNLDGTTAGTANANIGGGAKASFIACNAQGMSPGFNGSAVITSNVPVIAIGKAYGLGLSTAFVGVSEGAARIAVPYVRWASPANWAAGTQQRVNLTIQNIGDANLAAGQVTVRYIDRDGVEVGRHTLGAIAPGGKVNSNPNNAGLEEFGVYAGGQFGGGAMVVGPDGSQLAVVARVSTQVAAGQFASEDYNGIVVP
jgi:hypothetical protein